MRLQGVCPSDEFRNVIGRLPLYVLVVVAALYGLAPISDGDVFWNLNVGAWLLDNFALLPADDPFTYNAQPGGVQHEWLVQVVMAAIERAFGLNGLRLFGSIVAASAVLIAHRSFTGHGVRQTHAIAATSLWWIVVEPHAVLRPHLVGWLFALWVLGVRFSASPQVPVTKRSLGTLFLICVVWANAHASVLIAPFYAAVTALSIAVLVPPGRARKTDVVPWLQRSAVTLVAALCTPAGWSVIPYALSTPAINRELSHEWWPLLRADVWQSRPAVLIVWALIGLVVAGTVIWQLRRSTGEEQSKNSDLQFPGVLVAVIALAHAAVTRRMTVFLFLPLLYAVGRLAPTLSDSGHSNNSTKPNAWLAWVAVAIVLGLHGGAAASTLRAEPLVTGAFPFETTAFAREAGLQGRLFNPDGWGGYIAHRLPGTRVFADGRWPLVGREVIHDGFEIMLRRENIRARLDKYAIDWAILRTSDYLRVPGPDPQQWRLVWRDDTALVLIRRTARFAENVARACRFYGKYKVPERARWHVDVKTPEGVNSPSAVPSILGECG